MTRPENRRTILAGIEQARAAGARLAAARALAGIDPSTRRRWAAGDEPHVDRRPGSVRPTPAHALTEAERARIVLDEA